MAGGDNRNGRRVRRISEREDSENDENIDLEEAIEQYKNAREAIQERISELEAEGEVRDKDLKKFSENLNMQWNDIMDPISCSDTEDESIDDAPSKAATNEENNESRTIEVLSCPRDEKNAEDKEKSQDEYSSFSTSSNDDEEDEVDSTPKRKRKRRIKKVKSNCGNQNHDSLPGSVSDPITSQNEPIPATSCNKDISSSKEKKSKKHYRKSLSRIMFEWAQDQQEYKDNIAELRAEEFRSNDDIEKFAFFSMFEKKNEEYKEKLHRISTTRAAEWQQLKQKKKQELKEKYKKELRSWVSNERCIRINQDRKRQRKEYKLLRKSYLEEREDQVFEDKESALRAMVDRSQTLDQAHSNMADENITRSLTVNEPQHRNSDEGKTYVPSKKSKTLR